MLQCVLPATTSAPGQARTWAATVLEAWPQDTSDTVLLVLSELVTNAVTAADTGADTVTVEITFRASDVVVSVTDPSTAPVPAAHHPSEDAEHGRGLEIVSALCTQSGAEPRGCGKRVWAAVPIAEQVLCRAC